MDSLQNYLRSSIPDFFDLNDDENENSKDVEIAVEYVKWYKKHNSTHPNVNSIDLEEVHLAYWRDKINVFFKIKAIPAVWAKALCTLSGFGTESK
jgi:hypothetical protein